MVKKPKTVAFRVTEEEYEAMQMFLPVHDVKTVAHLVQCWIEPQLNTAVNMKRKAKKSREAAAKRAATKAAKKAANDDTK